MHSDEAFEFLVSHLAALPEQKDSRGNRNGDHNGDIWIPSLAWIYWAPHLDRRDGRYAGGVSDLEQERFIPFYDAVWELCRIGVLRPGEFSPAGISMAKAFGDSYTVTQFGRKWLREAAQRLVIDPSRLSELFQSFASKFGAGYVQRATEAVRTYRAANYLAACVMAGAAAESILLAIAIAKEHDEAKILAEYKTSGGRSRVTKRISGGVSTGLALQFETALQVLHYWRDDAGHGTMTDISEIQAHMSLTQLLRLAQFSSNHWTVLAK